MALSAFVALLAVQSQPKVETIRIGGVERTYIVYAPSRPTPHPRLVFGFHGHGGNMRQAARSFHMQSEMPEAVVVYMQGLPTKGLNDPDGTRNGWQQNSGQYEDRDLKFFDAVFEKVVGEYGVDKTKVYSMGHSNGGRFSYLLWKERPKLFTAFGPSGSPSFLEGLPARPFIHFAGEKDPLVPFLGQRLSCQRQMKINGCETAPSYTKGYLKFYKGKDGNDAATYFHPGGHEYPKDAPRLIAEFFLAH
ncbi:MAG: esterase [Fimbriimonadaceae bacterium]|nr:esterase [Fimbriimonadaceae bacterium]